MLHLYGEGASEVEHMLICFLGGLWPLSFDYFFRPEWMAVFATQVCAFSTFGKFEVTVQDWTCA